MAGIVVPPGISANGTIRVGVVMTAADTTAPKLTELSATSTVDAACYMARDGFAPGADQATINTDRLCLDQILQSPGAVTFTIDDITYIYDPQNALSVSNKLYAALAQGTACFFVVRWGLKSDVAWTVGQKVDVYPVTVGARVKLPPVLNEELRVKQKVSVTGQVQQDVALVA